MKRINADTQPFSLAVISESNTITDASIRTITTLPVIIFLLVVSNFINAENTNGKQNIKYEMINISIRKPSELTTKRNVTIADNIVSTEAALVSLEMLIIC